MKKFSHTARNYRRQGDDQSNWIVGWDYLILVFGAMFSAFMVTTMFRDTDPVVVDIAVFQLIMLFGGFIFGIVGTVKLQGGLGISVRPPNREDIEKSLPYMVGAFTFLAVLNRLIATMGLTSFILATFDANMNIALSAAVAEEAAFSFGFTTLAFKITDYMTKNVMGDNMIQENVAIFFAMLIVSLLFFVIHLAVYGTNIFIASMLVLNRFVYAFVYMKTKNIAVPTILHIVHNFMTFL